MAGKVTDFDALTTLADNDVFYVVQVSDGTDKKITKANLSDDISADVQTDISGDFLETADYPSDSAWTSTTSLSNGFTGTVRYIKRAGFVTFALDNVDGSSATSDVVLTISSDYYPAHILRGAGYDSIANTTNQTYITTSGQIACKGRTANIYAVITYPVI